MKKGIWLSSKMPTLVDAVEAFGDSSRSPPPEGGVVIFVTVGAQMPVDRLIRAVVRGRLPTTVTTCSPRSASRNSSRSTKVGAFLAPTDFKQRYEASKIVAHGGTSSINTLQLGKNRPCRVMQACGSAQ
jgi:hypothetical protein